MDPTATDQGSPGFPTHIQAQLERASQHVNMTQRSQMLDPQVNHPRSSYRGRQQHNPGRGQGRGQWPGQGQGRGQGQFQRPTVSHRLPEPYLTAPPQPSNSQDFPPLGSAASQGRVPGASASGHHRVDPTPFQTPIQTSPANTLHSTSNTPQGFSQDTRARSHRGPSAMRSQQRHRQHVIPTNLPPSGPNPALNNYSRPPPRNNNLYEPSSVADQQYLYDRVRLQHQFLMATASIALQTALTPAEGQEKEAFRLELESVAQAAVAEYAKSNSTLVDPKKVKLKCYGSLASGFAIAGSDLDLLLMFPKGKESVGSFESDCQRWLEKAFLDAGYGARLLTKTRVPILRVCQKPSSELLENLRKNRTRWEDEEGAPVKIEKQNNSHGPDTDRLPDATHDHLQAASKAFAELELSPADVPLPPSPVREHLNLEYKDNVGIHSDINFSNYVAIHNTTLLRCYCKCDPRVREMGLFVKAWAKARNINTPYNGTLSSYGYIMMVLHYLMNVAKPPVIPNLQHAARDADAWAGKTEVELFEGFDIRFDSNEQKIEHAARAGHITENKQNLGALLHGFFWYYSDRQGFRWLDEVISIRTVGGILTKRSKGWTEAKWAGEKNQVRLRYLFAIEDPFEIEHNIARTVGHSGVVAIRDEFRRAWEIVSKARLTHRGEWQWRNANGAIGEDLLAKAGDRGDLFKKDQEYHKKKVQDMRTNLAANKAREEDAKARGVDADGEEATSQGVAESGMSSVPMPKPTRTDKSSGSTGQPNSKLIRTSHPQLSPKQAKGRKRTLRIDDDKSGSDLDRRAANTSRGDARVVSKSSADTTSVQESQPDVKDLNESELTSQDTDSYCPYIDPDLLNASVPLRLEDVSVRPGPNHDGKPLAWNTNTQAGRWLHWRDQRIRRGETDSERYSTGLFDSWHRLFPYDASRPASGRSKREQNRQQALRERRIAHFTRQVSKSESRKDHTSSDTGEIPPAMSQHSVVARDTSRKDSAISGLTATSPDRPNLRNPGSLSPTETNNYLKPSAASESDSHTMLAEATNGITQASKTTSASRHTNKIDPSLRPRDEDPNIMPIPASAGFAFDPRQLRDIAIMRQGGNGCARGGEEWNVEIEGEWGGGGVMGALKTSSGLVTSLPIGGVGGGGGGGGEGDAGDGGEYGRGDEEWVLRELPDFAAVEV